MFPSTDTSPCSPLPSSGYRGRSFRKPCGSPPSQVHMGVRLLLHPSSVAYGLPWHPSYPSCERRWRALLGSWEIPLETCPELGTPAIPGRPSQLRSYPDAAFHQTKRRRHRNGGRFRSWIFTACFLAVYASAPTSHPVNGNTHYRPAR